MPKLREIRPFMQVGMSDGRAFTRCVAESAVVYVLQKPNVCKQVRASHRRYLLEHQNFRTGKRAELPVRPKPVRGQSDQRFADSLSDTE
jgi:hypothetical protein